MTDAKPLRELAPHLVWEAVLLLAAAGVVAGLYNVNAAVFTRGQVWAGIAILGFAACGLALSLRTATPNLAIAPVAVLAGWVFVTRVNDGASVAVAFLLAVLAAAGVGLVLALIVGLTALPAWAVTLGGGFIVSAAVLDATGARIEPLTRAARTTTGFGVWAAVFAVVSIGGAVLFAVPAVRRLLTANRPVAGGDDPARWRPAKLVGALVGVTGSAVLAGVSGVLSARLTGGAMFTDSGQLPYALAAVLLGGVSVFGRRAGVFGVVLAVVVIDGVRRWQALEGVGAAPALLTTGILAVVGLLVVWLLELVGRRVAPLSAVAFPGAAPGPLPVAGGFVPAGAGAPGFVPAGASSPVPPGSPAGLPAQPAGPASAPPGTYPPGTFAPPPPPMSGGPVFGQPTYPTPQAGAPGYPPLPPPPAGGQPAIPQPWTVPGTGAAPQVPSQPVSPPVSGPPSTDPPGYPPAPPPSWPPRQ
ncbi:hypothetical protein Daura_26075 [Dactylosporangium aurantiacum]|uniref:Uncharacterized protein n=1 Tax=Dactylosporangium aurantiacum TaxID=35754 RepID=A0A9Q9I9F5_9ACTN|nr:hypothetical protein [Dactylosporangium aurantiacum]MDG6109704.1 hypothetical protein [Dactylosporangium aurantiacum]UWZ50315.1 hypothetical protein Daura_26075 [Dactylosporangium aurantiacum]